MGKSKSEEFTDRQNYLAGVAKAIGHPARIAIIHFLARQKSCVCGDIVDELPLSQSTVSQHLKALKKAGLIAGEIEGTSVCYCLNTEAIKKFKADISLFLDEPANPKSCC
ncbi:MAG: winged helix-turn-helix transcriptional regulator [Balneolaceae bacterium]|nr:winged helix-turn-helix transcriptional regulator [Balneolaceae bacterium]